MYFVCCRCTSQMYCSLLFILACCVVKYPTASPKQLCSPSREEVKFSDVHDMNVQIPEILVLPTDNLFQMTLLGKSLTL